MESDCESRLAGQSLIMNKPSRRDSERNVKPTVFPFRPFFNYLEGQSEAISDQAIGIASVMIMVGVLYWICTLFDTF
jgi:hypothetical protein